eukprot:scaffold44521_cov46-Phaeocystis_antarctica.AAC.1
MERLITETATQAGMQRFRWRRRRRRKMRKGGRSGVGVGGFSGVWIARASEASQERYMQALRGAAADVRAAADELEQADTAEKSRAARAAVRRAAPEGWMNWLVGRAGEESAHLARGGCRARPRRRAPACSRSIIWVKRADSWGGMARLFGTPAVRPTVGLSVWRRREEGVTGEAGPEPLWPGSSGFDGLRVQGAGEAGAGPLRHGIGRLLSPAGWG